MEKEEFIHKDIESVPKFIAALKYLNQGRELTIDGYTFMLAETYRGGIKPMLLVGDTWMGTELSHLADMCNKLTEEEITIMQANMALQSFNKTR